MDKLDPPSSLNFDGNLAEQWKIWRQELELYLTATESDTKSDKIKTLILLTCIGKRGREIYNTFTWENVGDNLKFNIVIEKFKEYCNPRTNVTFLRYKFFTYKQVDGQSFDEFVTELKKRSAECQFGTLKDELVRDIIICGLADNRLRERLLRDPGLTLEKTIELGQAAEETKRHMKEMDHDSKSVDSEVGLAKGPGRRFLPAKANLIGKKKLLPNVRFVLVNTKEVNALLTTRDATTARN